MTILDDKIYLPIFIKQYLYTNYKKINPKLTYSQCKDIMKKIETGAI